jgi:K(+)-stimulated pyrophosphate-energized sodium pump
MSGGACLAVVLAVGAATLVIAALFARAVVGADAGTPDMRTIAAAIREGAHAFLRRQYRTVCVLAVAAAALVFVLYLAGRGGGPACRMTAAFVAGAGWSLAAGWWAMFVSVRANVRVASAARRSLDEAFRLALRAGAAGALPVVAGSLLGVGALFVPFGGLSSPQSVPYQLAGFGFGASFVALFAQLGGGICTKAADVAADLVGKLERGIPEDDPRNPAVIADLVGDNVGDCAGRGADLFVSTAAENIGAMILGVALLPRFGVAGILFPLLAAAVGLVASIAGLFTAKMRREDQDPMSALTRGHVVTAVLTAVGLTIAVRYVLGGDAWLAASAVLGLASSLVFALVARYYTSYRHRPALSIARSSVTGAATNVITGLAVGLESTALPAVTIGVALLGSYYCGLRALPGWPGAGLYGTAVATAGMLSPVAYVLSMDMFGPVVDNAGGIVEMSGQPEDVRARTDVLDAAGNTTKALTKSYSIGSAALAAFLLFSAYLDRVTLLGQERLRRLGDAAWGSFRFEHVDIGKVPVFVAALLGASVVLLFSALAIQAVSRDARAIVEEVRRQFRERPGILDRSVKADFGRCVDIATLGALKGMLAPGLLAVCAPVLVGLAFRLLASRDDATLGAEAVAAELMVGTIAGVLGALVMNTGGGAWDNAKKYIERGELGGKRSEALKAAVVGDTVGDPLKDTAGPSLHILIKLLGTLSLVTAPLFL